MDIIADNASIVEDFWLTVWRNDCNKAEAAVLCLETSHVTISMSYSFEMVEGEERQVVGGQDNAGALIKSPQRVMPDNPTSTDDAWNVDVGVSFAKQ